MNGFDERFLTRNGLAARRLAVLLLHHEPDTRLPRVRDFAGELGCGNGTVQAALRLLEESGAIETAARGHLGTFLVRSERSILWRLSGLGTLLAAMPLPYSRHYEGLATGLRTAFEDAGTPFAITFMRGSAARTTALLKGKVDLVVLSRLAADRLIEEHSGRLALVADLGPATYRSLRDSSAAIIGRTEGAQALSAVRDALDLSTVTSLQAEVLRGERVPSY